MKQKSFENNDFYNAEYLVQYKIIEKELKEISRLELISGKDLT